MSESKGNQKREGVIGLRKSDAFKHRNYNHYRKRQKELREMARDVQMWQIYRNEFKFNQYYLEAEPHCSISTDKLNFYIQYCQSKLVQFQRQQYSSRKFNKNIIPTAFDKGEEQVRFSLKKFIAEAVLFKEYDIFTLSYNFQCFVGQNFAGFKEQRYNFMNVATELCLEIGSFIEIYLQKLEEITIQSFDCQIAKCYALLLIICSTKAQQRNSALNNIIHYLYAYREILLSKVEVMELYLLILIAIKDAADRIRVNQFSEKCSFQQKFMGDLNVNASNRVVFDKIWNQQYSLILSNVYQSKLSIHSTVQSFHCKYPQYKRIFQFGYLKKELVQLIRASLRKLIDVIIQRKKTKEIPKLVAIDQGKYKQIFSASPRSKAFQIFLLSHYQKQNLSTRYLKHVVRVINDFFGFSIFRKTKNSKNEEILANKVKVLQRIKKKICQFQDNEGDNSEAAIDVSRAERNKGDQKWLSFWQFRTLYTSKASKIQSDQAESQKKQGSLGEDILFEEKPQILSNELKLTPQKIKYLEQFEDGLMEAGSAIYD